MSFLKWILLAAAAFYLFAPVFYGILLLLSAVVLRSDKKPETNSRVAWFIINGVSWVIVQYSGLMLKNEIRPEQIPDGRFLLVSNHRSNFDPFVLFCVLSRYEPAFICKREVLASWVLGPVLRRCFFMEIDRENPRNAIATINEASELIRSDLASVGVFPEGTRSRETGKLLPFHDGVFKIAKKTGCPVLVISMDGTEKGAKNMFRRFTSVRLRVADCLDSETVQSLSTSQIGERVRESLEKSLSGES